MIFIKLVLCLLILQLNQQVFSKENDEDLIPISQALSAPDTIDKIIQLKRIQSYGIYLISASATLLWLKTVINRQPLGATNISSLTTSYKKTQQALISNSTLLPLAFSFEANLNMGSYYTYLTDILMGEKISSPPLHEHENPIEIEMQLITLAEIDVIGQSLQEISNAIEENASSAIKHINQLHESLVAIRKALHRGLEK